MVTCPNCGGDHVIFRRCLPLDGGKSKSLAQRRADAPLRPAVEQRPIEFGLFGDRQLDLADRLDVPAVTRATVATMKDAVALMMEPNSPTVITVDPNLKP